MFTNSPCDKYKQNTNYTYKEVRKKVEKLIYIETNEM